MPTLYDQIIDEAEELATSNIIYNPSDRDIIEKVSELTGVSLGFNSTGGKLAIASFRRYDLSSMLKAS